MKKLERLAELRSNRNLSQQQVADLFHVSRVAYSNYERGARSIEHELLIQIADYYKVSADYILERTDNPILNEELSKDEIEFVKGSLDLYRKVKKGHNGV